MTLFGVKRRDCICLLAKIKTHLMMQKIEGPFAVDQHFKGKRQMVYGLINVVKFCFALQ